jgi:hypothetical protein
VIDLCLLWLVDGEGFEPREEDSLAQPIFFPKAMATALTAANKIKKSSEDLFHLFTGY